MPIIQDKEFGKVTIRRSPRTTQVKIRVAPDGTLHASLPTYAPLFLLKKLIHSSRDKLRIIINQAAPEYKYKNGTQIGKSHTLIIRSSTNSTTNISRCGQQIIVTLSINHNIDSPEISRKLRDTIITALRIEARSYLPKRLEYLSKKHGLVYKKTRFSHASSRWGSCSSGGTISLNIALMKLPFELIDYVIIHELAHTKHMNHGSEFWKLVGCIIPDYKIHRQNLKLQNPSI